MGKTQEIKGRMKAVASIKRITKTMQMIATAKFQASQRPAMAARPYTEKIAELVGELTAAAGAGGGAGDGDAAGGFDHPLLRTTAKNNGRQLLLVLSSNRGMCGAYNANILRTANAFLKDHAEQDVDIEVVGKKAVSYFRFVGTEIQAHHSHITDTPDADDVHRLADGYMEQFLAGKYDAVSVVYMAYESASRQKPTVVRLLPMELPQADEADDTTTATTTADYDFSPEPAELLGDLLPLTVRVRLLQCFREGVVSEHIARMVAMKSATDAAGKMGKQLTRTYNRARQAAITTELSEIISGAAALE